MMLLGMRKGNRNMDYFDSPLLEWVMVEENQLMRIHSWIFKTRNYWTGGGFVCFLDCNCKSNLRSVF